jgi:hypothetical protein
MITTTNHGAPLEAVLATQWTKRDFKNDVRRIVKRGKYRETLRRLQAGDTQDTECAKVLEYFRKAIVDLSEGVWWGSLRASDKGAPVQINRYRGIFWAWALGVDPVGYFPDEKSAVSFVRNVWDARESTSTVDDGGEVCCPYCDSVDSCKHHLLTVDITFGEAHGGSLYREFNRRKSLIRSQSREPLSDSEIFEQAVDEVARLADERVTEFSDPGPGQSSELVHYYCESQERVLEVVRQFCER